MHSPSSSSNSETTPQYLDERELSRAVNIPVPTLRTWRVRTRRAGPPFLKIGRRVLYDRAAVTRWLSERVVDPAAGAVGGR